MKKNILIFSIVLSGLIVFLLKPLLIDLFYTKTSIDVASYFYREISFILICILLLAGFLCVILMLLVFLINLIYMIGKLAHEKLYELQRVKKQAFESTKEERAYAAQQIERKHTLYNLTPSATYIKYAQVTTMIAMTVSFITTAMGFEMSIMDPHAPAWFRWGLAILLSISASIIIYIAWEFLFKSISICESYTQRLTPAFLSIIVVILTLSISTSFGVVGIGGTEAQRTGYEKYATKLDVSYQLIEASIAAEKRALTPIKFAQSLAKQSANQELKSNAICGPGQGELYKYYTGLVDLFDTTIDLISETQNTKDLKLNSELADIRYRIRISDDTFEKESRDLAIVLKELRTKVTSLKNTSSLQTIDLVKSRLERVYDEQFFSNWPECQRNRKEEIRNNVKAISNSLDSILYDITEETEKARKNVIDQYGSSYNDVQLGTVPEFVPVSKFWSVVRNWRELPGYLALQLAIDLAPFIFFLFIFIVAPLAQSGTVERLRRNVKDFKNEYGSD